MDLDLDLPGMDVRTLSEQGVECLIRDNRGLPLMDKDGQPVAMTVLGPESLRYRELMQEAAIERIRRQSAGLAMPSFAEAQARTDQILAECVTHWRGFYTKAGDEIPLSTETAAAIFDRYPNIRRQIDDFQSNRVHFTMAS